MQSGKYFAESWCETWHFKAAQDCFSSKDLQQLRVARRQTVEQHLRKDSSLQIRQIHRQELKQWKSNQLNAFLGNPSRWKDLRDYLPRPSGRRSLMFASMLEALFVGPCQPLQRPMRLTEPGRDLSELRFAVQRLKTRKCGGELGLTAELLKHAPEEFVSTLLTLYNNVLVTGERPESWCKTLFSMLPKKTKPLQPADFRPIANIRVLIDLTFLTLRLHVRRQPSLGRRQCETKTSASGAKLYQIITQLHPQRRILCKVIPVAPLSKTRVCHKLASPIMAWVPPSSCTSRIPK